MEMIDDAESAAHKTRNGPGPKGVAGLIDDALREIQREIELRGSLEVRKARRQVLRGVRCCAYLLELKGDANPTSIYQTIRDEVFEQR